ncbi:FAD-dependent oxidoreductase [Nocardioidaceae bacterium SCSIO 66511]|nr:FAD-dependent oxidoreductase [Nocardioidaceae bacterium SCSIO 66511]
MEGSDSVPTRCDVVVVGGGLSGLACAVPLTNAGLDLCVLEASDDVGGRVRTDVVDGFRLDRGFQLLNSAYPEARRVLDLDALELRRFDRAALLQIDGHSVRITDPRRDMRQALQAVGAPLGGVKDKRALATYAGLASGLPARALRGQRDVTARTGWRRRGLSDAVVDRVLRSFFEGMVLEAEMETSIRFVDLMMRMFVRGDAVVPALGMQQIPRQLAVQLRDDAIHLLTPARRVRANGVDTDAGSIEASAVVVATYVDDARSLVGGLARPLWRGVMTVYHVAPRAPVDDPILVVDSDPPRVSNTVVMSAAAASYSPDDRALIATSLVPDPNAGIQDLRAVRERLATLYRTSTSAWEPLATYDIAHALPAMKAPHSFRKPVRHGGVYVCGDHRDTSSIQGALVSGRRPTTAVLADLAGGPRLVGHP